VDAETHLIACQRYIELNLVRANMVVDPADYRWSSYHSDDLGRALKLWKLHEVYLWLGRSQGERLASYRSLFSAHMDEGALDNIRAATQKGLAVGSEKFKAQVAALTGRRVTWRKRGPKKRHNGQGVEAQELLL
jgi:putative transposase